MSKIISKYLLLLFLLLPVGTKAGPGYPACILACELACCGTLIIPVLLPIYLACAQTCPAACIASCLGSGTQIIVASEGREIEKSIETIEAGDTVLTLENGKPKWTRVLRNIKTEGKSQFIQIDAQNDDFGSNKKQLKVTPEHGMILVNEEGNIISPAKNVQIGDKIIAENGEILSVISVAHLVMDEKYTLETFDGTVLASLTVLLHRFFPPVVLPVLGETF